MTKPKPGSYLDETLKRWPIILLVVGGIFTGISLYQNLRESNMRTEAKIDKILTVMNVKEESASEKYGNLIADISDIQNRQTETEKKIFPMWELYRKQIKKEED